MFCFEFFSLLSMNGHNWYFCSINAIDWYKIYSQQELSFCNDPYIYFFINSVFVLINTNFMIEWEVARFK